MRQTASEALSEAGSEVSLSDQVMLHSDCQRYFGQGGLFEHAKRLRLIRVELESKCISEFPESLEELSLIEAVSAQAVGESDQEEEEQSQRIEYLLWRDYPVNLSMC